MAIGPYECMLNAAESIELLRLEGQIDRKLKTVYRVVMIGILISLDVENIHERILAALVERYKCSGWKIAESHGVDEKGKLVFFLQR